MDIKSKLKKKLNRPKAVNFYFEAFYPHLNATITIKYSDVCVYIYISYTESENVTGL